MRNAWVLLLIHPIALGCGSDGDPTPAGQSAPVECGELTCSGSEMCVVPQSLGPWFDGPEAHACAPIPDGCGGLGLCSCPALEDDYGELSIVGCSLLGERSIYVADVSCGDRRCLPEEYCLVRTLETTQDIGSMECRPLPAGCEPGADFCGEDGCFTETIVDELPVMGCLESDHVRAVSVDGR
jgi:hypothetical protein